VSILALHSGAFARGQVPFTLGPASEGRPCSHWGLHPRAGPVHTRACAREQALFTLGPAPGSRPCSHWGPCKACARGQTLITVGRAPMGRSCSQWGVRPGAGPVHSQTFIRGQVLITMGPAPGGGHIMRDVPRNVKIRRRRIQTLESKSPLNVLNNDRGFPKVALRQSIVIGPNREVSPKIYKMGARTHLDS
jgi:hypothetical protein